jgi:hypothetical protein
MWHQSSPIRIPWRWAGTDGRSADLARWTGRPGSGLGRLTARFLRHDGHQTYTLDTDATLVKCAMPSGATRVCGYMPMLGFCGEAPVCLVGECREGNVSPGACRRTLRHRNLWNIYICSWASGVELTDPGVFDTNKIVGMTDYSTTSSIRSDILQHADSWS